MATIDMTKGDSSTGNHARVWRTPYAVERTISFAEATTSKGSALASADVIQAIPVPAGTIVHGAIAEVLTVDGNTGATFDLDLDAGDDFVDGGDLNTAGYVAPGTNGLLPFGANSEQATSAANTIDLLIAGAPGDTTVSAGVVRVVAFMTDVSDVKGPETASRTTL